jgi:DNA-binding MurR/RpiR family transcriptional regulator
MLLKNYTAINKFQKQIINKIALNEKIDINKEFIIRLNEITKGDLRKSINLLERTYFLDNNLSIDILNEVSGQLKNDLLIVMSVSGNSKNLLNCAKWVRKKQGKVFGILGCNGGKLKRFCNDSIIIPSKIGEFGPVEDLQLIINHILAHWFQITLQK